MLFHYTFRGPQDHVWSASFPVLGQIFKYGYLGVDVFFILSGFVILLTAYDKDAVSFGIARMVRLYPAYWICLTLTAVAILLAGNNHNQITRSQYLANLTMAHSYFGIRDVSGVYWTLAVELKFYFLIFLLLAFRQAQRMGYFLGLWLGASIFLSFQAPHGVARFFLFPEWSSYFIAGATFFLVYRQGPSIYKLVSIIACYVLSVCYATSLLPAAGAGPALQVSAPVLISLVTIFYLVFLVITLRRRTENLSTATGARLSQPQHAQPDNGGGAIFSRPSAIEGAPKAFGAALRWRRPRMEAMSRSGSGLKLVSLLGFITYPLYLIHQDIGYILLRLAPPGLNRHFVLLAVCFLAIGLSLLIHLGPEKWVAGRLKGLLVGAKTIGSNGIAIAALGVQRLKIWAPARRAVVPAIEAAVIPSQSRAQEGPDANIRSQAPAAEP